MHKQIRVCCNDNVCVLYLDISCQETNMIIMIRQACLFKHKHAGPVLSYGYTVWLLFTILPSHHHFFPLSDCVVFPSYVCFLGLLVLNEVFLLGFWISILFIYLFIKPQRYCIYIINLPDFFCIWAHFPNMLSNNSCWGVSMWTRAKPNCLACL